MYFLVRRIFISMRQLRLVSHFTNYANTVFIFPYKCWRNVTYTQCRSPLGQACSATLASIFLTFLSLCSRLGISGILPKQSKSISSDLAGRQGLQQSANSFSISHFAAVSTCKYMCVQTSIMQQTCKSNDSISTATTTKTTCLSLRLPRDKKLAHALKLTIHLSRYVSSTSR